MDTGEEEGTYEVVYSPIVKVCFLGAKSPSVRGIYEPQVPHDIQGMTKNNLHE